MGCSSGVAAPQPAAVRLGELLVPSVQAPSTAGAGRVEREAGPCELPLRRAVQVTPGEGIVIPKWHFLLLASFLAPRPGLGLSQVRKTPESRVTSQRSTSDLNLSCCRDKFWSAGRRERAWGAPTSLSRRCRVPQSLWDETRPEGCAPGLVLAQSVNTLWILSPCTMCGAFSRRCSFCPLSLPRPCFPQLCRVRGICCRRAALCSTPLPVCHLMSMVCLLSSASLPPPVSGCESLQWGCGKAS